MGNIWQNKIDKLKEQVEELEEKNKELERENEELKEKNRELEYRTYEQADTITELQNAVSRYTAEKEQASRIANMNNGTYWQGVFQK